MPDTDVSDKAVSWDTQPITMSMWASALEDHLSSTHSDYDTLISGGYAFSSRNQVACQSAAHAWLLKEQLMPIHTFKDPCPLIVDADPTLSGLFTSSTWAAIPDEYKSRYDVKPEFLSQRHMDMGKDIIKTITTQAGRKLLRGKAKPTGAGVVMLVLIHAEVKTVSKDADDAIALKLHHLEQAGIVNASVKAWNEWKEEYEEWVDAATIPIPDAAIAQRYVRVVSALGQVVEDKLEVRLEISSGHNDRAKTVEAINTVLHKIETKRMSDELSKSLGGAHAASDPNSRARDPGSSGDNNDKVAKRPPPSPCPEPGCGLMHWRSDCPKAKARKLKERKNKDGKAAAGSKAAASAKAAADAATIAALQAQLKIPTAPPAAGPTLTAVTPPGGGAAALPDVLSVADSFFEGGEQVVSLSGLGAAGLAGPTAEPTAAPAASANGDPRGAADDGVENRGGRTRTHASATDPGSRPGPTSLARSPSASSLGSDSDSSDPDTASDVDESRKVTQAVVLDRDPSASEACLFWSISTLEAAGVYYGRWSSMAALVAGYQRQGDSKLPKGCKAYKCFDEEQAALDYCLRHAQALFLDLSEYQLSPGLRRVDANSSCALPPATPAPPAPTSAAPIATPAERISVDHAGSIHHHPGAGSQKYYGVTNREHAGIHYGSWTQVRKVVDGFSSPGRISHRGFARESHALDWLESQGVLLPNHVLGGRIPFANYERARAPLGPLAPVPPVPAPPAPISAKRCFHVLALHGDVEYFYGYTHNVEPMLDGGARFHGGEHYMADDRAAAERLAAKLLMSASANAVARPANAVDPAEVWAAKAAADGSWEALHFATDEELATALDASLSAGTPFIRFGPGSTGEADARYFAMQRQPAPPSWPTAAIAALRGLTPTLRSALQFGANAALIVLLLAFVLGPTPVTDPGAPTAPHDPGARAIPSLLCFARLAVRGWVGALCYWHGLRHLSPSSIINLEPTHPFPARWADRWCLRPLPSRPQRRPVRSRACASQSQASGLRRRPPSHGRPPGAGPPYRTPSGCHRRRPPLDLSLTSDFCRFHERRLSSPSSPTLHVIAPAAARCALRFAPLILRAPLQSALLCAALVATAATASAPIFRATDASRDRGFQPDAPTPLRAWDDDRTSTPGAALWGSPSAVSKAAPGLVKFIVDSGCCWHVINNPDLLVNRRSEGGSMYGADGVLKPVVAIGDLPITCRDANGRVFERLLPNVRCVPAFTVCMLSVGQLWRETSTDVVFRDCNHLALLNGTRLPFRQSGDGLFYWDVSTSTHARGKPCRLGQPLNCAAESETVAAGKARACAGSAIRRGTAHSHFDVMAATELSSHLHRRLHVNHDVIRRLHLLSADVPDAVSRCERVACPHCAEANSTLTTHKSARYRPSRPGQLIHADIAGPFKPSAFGGYRYALFLIDDHSRFKWVYFMQHKSDAPGYVRAFLSSFSTILRKKHGAVGEHSVGAIHTDNAGEFLSREFTELLDKEQIAQTTCPPHVHALNGVAERAIRTIFSLARSNLVASAAPVSFWPQAVRHALDVANRVHGPPDSSASSFEMVTDAKPKLLNIMPFGCRAFAVKARPFLSKTNIDAHAWVGIHVGRSARSPGAYDVWVPSVGRLVTTSEVYFDETLFPWRPKEDQRDAGSLVTPPPPLDEHSGFLGEAVENAPIPRDSTVADRGVADSGIPALTELARQSGRALPPSSRRVLILFSGSYARRDSLKAYLEQLGLEADLVDNDAAGGDERHDVLNDPFFNKLLHRVRRGDYSTIFAAPPCSTFSISRFFSSQDTADGGPPPVRSKTFIRGLPTVPAAHRRELEQANEIVRRTALLLTLGHAAGSEFIVEHPCDRSDKSLSSFVHEEHGSIWQMPELKLLASSTGASSATFAQCRFDCEAEKLTTVLYTPGMAPHLGPLDQMRCQHGQQGHASRAGGTKGKDVWHSHKFAAYPAALNLFFAQAIFQMVRNRPSRPDVTSNSAPVVRRPPRELLPHDSDPLGPNATAEPRQPAPRQTPPESPARPPQRDDSHDLAASPSPIAADRARPAPEADGAVRRAGQLRGLGSGRAHTRSQGPALTSLAALVLYAQSAKTLATAAPFNVSPALAARSSCADPQNYAVAIKADPRGWRASMVKELLNHDENKSWEWIDACDVPHNRKLVRFTWVYKTKRDGTQKSRLCVQGCTQVAGVDYDQTFCATMRATSVRVLASLGAQMGLRMRRWDFTAAYLQGSLLDGEVVYCKPPPGYERTDVHGNSNLGRDGNPRVAKVNKPIYGMAQAGRRWQRSLFPWLVSHGFVACSRDPCVFRKEKVVTTPRGDRRETVIIGCYVDDLLTLYSHDDEHSLYHQFITDLQKDWKVEDEGETSDLLNVEFVHDHVHKCVTLHQRTYIEKMMEQHSPDGVPPRFQRNSAPAQHDLPQLVSDAQALHSAGHIPDPQLLRRYQGLVGALLYCSTHTRPDVAYATGMLCRAMACPTPELHDEALRVLHYLYLWRDIGLTYSASDLPLHGYSDSDWAVRHSTSGWTFQFNRATVSWGSKKQASVALSSCEAEIMAASEAAKEAVYLRSLLSELGVHDRHPTSVGVDNQSAKALAHNPELHSRTKHIDRRHFFVREAVEDFRISVPFVSTADNLADFFTKPLRPSAFFPLRDKIMNVASA